MVALLKLPREEGGMSWAERRMFDRAAADGQAEAHRMDHTIAARRDPRLTLRLRDLSLGGVAAVADRPVQLGEEMSVVFPRKGIHPAWDARGRVVRCEATPYGYCIGLEFNPMLAA